MAPSSTPDPGTPSEQASSQNMPSSTEIISGTTHVSGQASPDAANETKSAACPKLDSQLNQVLASADPLNTAQQMELSLKENRIQVLIVLSSPNTDFLQDYELEPGVQSGNELQTYIALSQLCELSSRDEILAIRLPAAAFIP